MRYRGEKEVYLCIIDQSTSSVLDGLADGKGSFPGATVDYGWLVCNRK